MIPISVEWPSRLLLILLQHLERAEDQVSPSMPPLVEQRINVFSFFIQYTWSLKSELLESGKIVDEEIVDCCIHFLLELLEQSCADSFLFSKERRLLTLAAAQKEREVKALYGGSDPQKTKKRRFEGQKESVPCGCVYKFARVLPIEYLLRIVASLSPLLDHYNNLGGCAVPAYSTEPLWTFVNHMLQVLDKNPNLFVPLCKYVPMK